MNLDTAKHVVLATSLWAIAGAITAAPISVATPDDRDHDSGASAALVIEDASAGAAGSEGDTLGRSDAAAYASHYQRLAGGAPLTVARRRDAAMPSSGLQWTMSGARPALEYRVAPHQVLRLRGLRGGALLMLRWDF